MLVLPVMVPGGTINLEQAYEVVKDFAGGGGSTEEVTNGLYGLIRHVTVDDGADTTRATHRIDGAGWFFTTDGPSGSGTGFFYEGGEVNYATYTTGENTYTIAAQETFTYESASTQATVTSSTYEDGTNELTSWYTTWEVVTGTFMGVSAGVGYLTLTSRFVSVGGYETADATFQYHYDLVFIDDYERDAWLFIPGNGFGPWDEHAFQAPDAHRLVLLNYLTQQVSPIVNAEGGTPHGASTEEVTLRIAYEDSYTTMLATRRQRVIGEQDYDAHPATIDFSITGEIFQTGSTADRLDPVTVLYDTTVLISGVTTGLTTFSINAVQNGEGAQFCDIIERTTTFQTAYQTVSVKASVIENPMLQAWTTNATTTQYEIEGEGTSYFFEFPWGITAEKVALYDVGYQPCPPTG